MALPSNFTFCTTLDKTREKNDFLEDFRKPFKHWKILPTTSELGLIPWWMLWTIYFATIHSQVQKQITLGHSRKRREIEFIVDICENCSQLWDRKNTKIQWNPNLPFHHLMKSCILWLLFFWSQLKLGTHNVFLMFSGFWFSISKNSYLSLLYLSLKWWRVLMF
jgi:hypothetical protein